MADNFQSLLFAYFKDGQYVQFPLFEDLGASQIVYIRQLNCPDANGTLIPSFMIVAQDPKSLQAHVYYVQTQNYLSSLALLQTALNALSTQNSFTLYTGLRKIDAFDVIGDYNQPVLISDLHAQGRKYDVNSNQTIITINIQTNLIYTKIYVDGDQTTAGDYYYNTYLTP